MSLTQPSFEPVRFGILGAANIAREFMAGVQHSPLVIVRAVASRDENKARDFAKTYHIDHYHASYEAMLADPDIEAVYIPLPNDLHAHWAIKAVEAGKHVLCEKPLAVGLKDAQAMFAAARKARVKLAEAYPYMAQPQTLKMNALLAEGAIGSVQTVSAAFGFGLVTPDGLPVGNPENIRLLPDRAGGGLLDAGTYSVSLVRLATGERPSRVIANGRFTKTGVDQTVTALLEFPSGALGHISCSMSVSFHRKALIVGSNGVIETDYSNHGPEDGRLQLTVKQGVPKTIGFETTTVEAANGFLLEAESFATWVRTGAGWTGASESVSLDVAATLEAIAKSLKSGQFETVAGA